MFEVIAVLWGLARHFVFGVGQNAAVVSVIQLLMQLQIVFGVVGAVFTILIVMGVITGAGALAGHNVAGSGGFLVGLLGGALGGGILTFFVLLQYALRKAMLIGGCWLFMQGFPEDDTKMIIAGILYGIAFLWGKMSSKSSSSGSSSSSK